MDGPDHHEVPHVVDDPHAFKVLPFKFLEYLPEVQFPAPTGININMMPFRIDDPARSVPASCEAYLPFIYHCRYGNAAWHTGDPSSRIWYLTIQEDEVPVGSHQRRAGLHIERPRGGGGEMVFCDRDHPWYPSIMWGLGSWHVDLDVPYEGIYVASTVSGTCRVWPKRIVDPERTTDHHGGIEHLRQHLGEGTLLRANEVCWMTDATPHEHLPVPPQASGATHVHRQFFRLVAGPIGVWYSKHNTPNPLGVLPDAPISDEDKFGA